MEDTPIHSAGTARIKPQPNRQIMPIGIVGLDEGDLPISSPVLQLLFAGDGGVHVPEYLVADEPVDCVPFGKAVNRAAAMLVEPCNQIAGNTDIERSMRFAGKDVDARLALETHGTERADKWTPDQVRGDGLLFSRHAELVWPRPAALPASISKLGAEAAG